MPDIGVSGGGNMLRRLDQIAQGLDRGLEVRVGFLAGATYPDGTSVPLVAFINEYGRPFKGQPPRPFFRSMIAEKSGSWGAGLGQALRDSNYDARQALDRVGFGIEGQLRQSIVEFTDPPLAPSTVKRKSHGGIGPLHGVLGPSKPLVDTGHMLNSIDHEVTTT